MTIPLVLFLIPYAIVIGLVIIFAIVNLYHLLHYGFFYFGAALATYVFFGIIAVVLLWAFQELSTVNWAQSTLTIGTL